VIRQIYTSGLRGKLGEEISAGLMENPVQSTLTAGAFSKAVS
jgi:citrate lyase alpha subunit